MKRLYEQNKRLFTLVALLLVSLFLIFFVGRRTDDAGNNNLVVTPRGLQEFRLGMDIAGGTSLTYKIDYSKYRAQFQDNLQFEQAKSTAEQIILTQIDNRISKLGVSDYSAYPQTLDNQEYVVVELGGVLNNDEAKEIIGKTVELEFKLEKEGESSQEEIRQREVRAQNILADILENPEQMSGVASNNQSEDIYYTENTDVSFQNLPTIYQENIGLINSIETGVIHTEVLDGLYQDFPEEAEAQGLTDLRGFVMFRMLERRQEEAEDVSAAKVESVARATNKSYTTELTPTDIGETGEVVYDEQSQEVIYNAGEVFSGLAAYDAVVYQYDAALVTDVDALIATLQSGGTTGETDTTLLYEGRIDNNSILGVVPGFTYQEDQPWQAYPSEGMSFIVGVRDQKAAQDQLFDIHRIANVTPSDFTTIQEQLNTNWIYSYEEIFVRETESWVAAIDPETNEILNGAYFELARVGQTQLGEPAVVIQFNDGGKRIFCNITEQNIGRQMAIFVGGALKTNPVIQDKICGGETLISGSFDRDSAKQLVQDLNEGALPAPLILTQEEKISPTLGTQALEGVMRAGLIGFVLIFVYMFIQYGVRYAVVSLLVLLGFVIYLGGLLKLVGYVVSLSGLAAIILTLGMSIDANILIFERIREEQGRQKNTKDAILEAYNRSWSPIRDGNLSTGLIALLLFMMGVNVFKGFGSMMIIAIILILFAIVRLTKELLLIALPAKKN